MKPSAWNAGSAFANCGRAVAHVRGSNVPVTEVANLIRSLDRRWRSGSALLDRDGKTADQPCDRLQVPGVLVFEESGEPLNTFVVAVEKRYAIDLSFSL